MSLTEELRQKYHDLWERMVAHPFVVEMGEGTLPVEKFRRYFLQDYVFVDDLVAMTAMGIAKAPDFGSADRLNRFLAGILNPENDLFVRAFKELGASEEDYTSAGASPSSGTSSSHSGCLDMSARAPWSPVSCSTSGQALRAMRTGWPGTRSPAGVV